MPDMPWHDYSASMKAAVSAGNLAEFERLRREAFDRPNVVRKAGMAYEANKQGHAFTALGCTDMMQRLCDAGAKWNLPEYLGLAEECGRTVLVRWKDGGLLSDEGWFLHARTSEKEKTRGASLNKALIAIYNMASSAGKFASAGKTAFANDLRMVATKCIEQLADPRAWPNWGTFIPTYKGKPVARSWFAYGLDWDRRSIYFLKDAPEKNGMYAIKSMEMLAAIHPLLGFDMGKYRGLTFGKQMNVCAWFLKTMRIKKRDGWYVNSKSKGDGNFGALSPQRNPKPVMEPWLKAFLKEWA